MEGDVEHVLLSREQIADRIKTLAGEIGRDLDDLSREGEVVLVPVLTGSIIFVADLMRQLPHKMRLSLVTVSSYPGKATQSRGAHMAGELTLADDLAGKHVLIVDDILDSGSTIRLIRQEISKRQPASVRTCVLLRKTIPSAMSTPCEYVGFDIPDVFIVGYGLDYDNYYRNLPDVCTLRKDAM